MIDKISALWHDAEQTVLVILFTFWAGITRTIFINSKRTLGTYLISVFVSIPAGTLSHYVLIEMGLKYYIATALAVLIGIVAHDFIEALLSVFKNHDGIAELIKKRIGINDDKTKDN